MVMSAILKSVDTIEDFTVPIKIHERYNRKSKKLKTKQPISKHNCHNELKKKLKKYKLRHDGKEDPEVLDVSQILVATLKIKSPTNQNNILIDESDENIKPKNYLFKMRRRKPLVAQSEQIDFNSSTDTSTLENHTKFTVNTLDELNIETNEDTVQKNAFKVMMASRNMSIGGNSPGKEKIVFTEDENVIEQKNIKMKRKLVLEKMAESKGSLKNKEIEEYQDKLIKKKMKNRAERLKKMLTSSTTGGENTKETVTVMKNRAHKNEENRKKKLTVMKNTDYKNGENTSKNASVMKTTDESKNRLKIIDLFSDSIKNLDTTNFKEKSISEEDQEFLKKLSPSLKKKENMLSYFKKIEKDTDISNLDIETVENEDKTIIKVKLGQKVKKKLKKRKLSLNNKNNIGNICSLEINDGKDQPTENSFEASNTPYENNETKVNDYVDAVRPRRNIKRAKYINEIHESNSDEELYIFTPKKKKQINNNEIDSNLNSDSPKKALKAVSSKQNKNTALSNDKINNAQKKSVKLAPIFNVKPSLDPIAIEAKQKFLCSGVPDKLKKIFEKQNHANLGFNCFTPVIHVQQIELSNISLPKRVHFDLCDEDYDVESEALNKNFAFETLLTRKKKPYKLATANDFLTNENLHSLLNRIKQSYPKFPVYRTFKLLKDKNQGVSTDCNYRDHDNSIEVMNGMTEISKDEVLVTLNWTDKYKPMSSKQIIGNFQTTKELKKWLISWTENDLKIKQKVVNTSDSSDFYVSDTDSTDCMKNYNNLLIVTGPVGSGKTSMVYAVASELAIKVLEVNASSKRTGKIMLQDLQEATQSHKVNRGMTSSQEPFQKEQDEIKVPQKCKKRGRPKKSLDLNTKALPRLNKEEEVNHVNYNKDNFPTCMSLVLIDDADIVFEQDDGFCSAIVQLVQSSKRPVILIASTNTCPHLQRFFCSAKLLHTKPFQPTMLGTWLDLLCLAETNICFPGLSARFLDHFQGDIRKTMNFMQFCLSQNNTLEEVSSQSSSDCYKVNIDDENSNISWIENGREGFEEDNKIVCSNNFEVNKIWQQLMYNEINLKDIEYPFNIFNVWWNIPNLLDIKLSQERKVCKNSTDLKDLSNILDMMSVADIVVRSDNFMENITDKPWLSIESHSVSELETFDDYFKINGVLSEIAHHLVCNSILNTQEKILNNKEILDFPGTVVKRERDRVVSRHHSLTKYLNQSAVLDRRALALDYWSGSRTICRIEKAKTDTNVKRNNRFCHYLKSQNILSSNETFDSLCKSLNFN